MVAYSQFTNAEHFDYKSLAAVCLNKRFVRFPAIGNIKKEIARYLAFWREIIVRINRLT